MLSMPEIQAHLQTITYRPGWEFIAYEGRFEGHHLVIRARVENSYRPGETILLDVHSALPPMQSTRHLEEWLLWRLIRVEAHEAREFFRVNGVLVFDPHAPDADKDLDVAA